MKINETLRAKFASRIFLVSKIADKRKAMAVKKGVRECFPGIDIDKNLRALGAVVKGPTYESACSDIFELLQQNIKDLKPQF